VLIYAVSKSTTEVWNCLNECPVLTEALGIPGVVQHAGLRWDAERPAVFPAAVFCLISF